MKRLITCPETAHLEAIEVELDADGRRILRVLRCSRFCPDNHVLCEGLCGERLNQRLDSEGGDEASEASEASEEVSEGGEAP